MFSMYSSVYIYIYIYIWGVNCERNKQTDGQKKKKL